METTLTLLIGVLLAGVIYNTFQIRRIQADLKRENPLSVERNGNKTLIKDNHGKTILEL